jgi:hypothetical protein
LKLETLTTVKIRMFDSGLMQKGRRKQKQEEVKREKEEGT